MKKFKSVSLILSVLAACVLGGCSKNDTTVPTDEGITAGDNLLFADNTIGNGDKEFVFTGEQTLKKGTYLLKGWVYIKAGAKLTIEAGTIIKGDKETKAALIVERGGQLFAQGTAQAPVVMTSGQPAGSRRPGDWGGLIICGKARNNQNEQQIEGGPRTKHGGENDEDNSGVISYVRVEFAGFPFATDKEINGITFGSVGRGTKVDHLQVSYSNDDSYEWFGGTVNCKYLVAYHGWDDEFDTDNGFSGKLQFLLSVRDPRIADISQSNGFESDNCADGAAVSPYTAAVFSNATFIGPRVASDFVNNETYINGGTYNPNNGSGLGKFQSAMQIRRNSRLCCFNSVAVGYPVGLILDKEKGDSQDAATKGLLKLQHLYFAGMGVTGSDANKVYEDFLVTGYDKDKKAILDKTQPSFSSTYFKTQGFGNVETTLAALALTEPAGSKVGAGYLPGAGSVLLNAASFSDAFVSSGFDQVNYVGAFSGVADDWMNGWTNFDPQNTAY